MSDSNDSPTRQAFHAQGQAQVAEMQNEQLQTQIAQQQAQPQVQV